MSALTPTDAASCRAMAVECGRRANDFYAMGASGSARREIDRARELTLLALKFEQEASGTHSRADGGADIIMKHLDIQS